MTGKLNCKKRLCAAFSAAVMILSLMGAGLFAVPSFAVDDPTVLYSKNVCIYNVDYDTLIYGLGIDDPVYPAGTVKIMTALLALEHYDDYSKQITVTKEMIADVSGSAVGFEEGEVLTVEELLAALIVSNANDAALILAYDVAGNSGAFLKMMNARAEELGMTNTRYYNVTGLHTEPMKTTARDVLTVTREAIRHREYTDLAGSAVYIIPDTNKSGERKLHNRNFFVSTYYNLYYYIESVSGVSCSYTGNAGYCMSVTASDRAGMNYITVVMNSDESGTEGTSDIHGCDDAVALMNWAFKNYSGVAVVNTDNMVCEIPVSLSSSTDHVIALPEKKITALLPNDVDLAEAVRTEYTLKSENLTAPVKAGEVIGELTVFVNGKEYGTVNLVAKNNVDRSMWLYLLHRIGKFLSHPLMIVIIVLAVLVAAAYGVLVSIRNVRRQQNRVSYKRKK